ncbi:MAG: single-stranded-DNA-specific exonuclease RecJ [Oscillospiraceae bacterium]|nr:single-stranded-DNA-specific exonuclease RecJ [Oscillospiraceae bacterium]
MMRFMPKESAQPPQVLLDMGLDAHLAQLLALRGVDTPEAARAFLSPDISQLHDPGHLLGMGDAVSCIRRIMDAGGRIVVYGDYDVDGVSATAILLTYLRQQGARVDYYIPSRHGEGYGLNARAVEKLAKQADLLITVDCGITSPDEAALARKLGLALIITDHHQPGPHLPDCAAVLNPVLGSYPWPKLCGAGVALKLVQALGGQQAILPLLDLAALATIADVVPLLDENRVIVSLGLALMREKPRIGLRALMDAAAIAPSALSAGRVAFQLAPRINAGGRLADAGRGVTLLTTDDEATARGIALDLDHANRMRQEVEQRILDEAEAMLQRDVNFLRDKAILLCGQGWNPGVVGLAASRLVEKYRWPVVLLSQDGDVCVGSARSIPGIDIYRALRSCADLFLRFGGHAQAAGLTLQAANLPQLKARLNAAIAGQAQPDTFMPTEYYDLEMDLAEVTEPFVSRLEMLQPTGMGNPAPVFCLRGVRASNARAVGKEGNHLKLLLSQDGEARDAIAFHKGTQADAMPACVDVLFCPTINEWREVRNVQCEVRQIAPHTPARAFLDACAKDAPAFLRAICRQILYNNSTPPPPADGVERDKLRMLATDELDRAITAALARDTQGTLLVARTLPGLRKWIVRLAAQGAPLQYCLGAPTDPRLFNTLCAAADLSALPVHLRCIALLDGALAPGEAETLADRLPQTEILCATDAASLLASALDGCVPTDDALRALYRALRDEEIFLAKLREKTGLSSGAVEVGLAVLHELRLVDYTPLPWTACLLPPHKCTLMDSVLLCALRGA